MAFAVETKTLTAICHCRSTHFTVTVPKISFPLRIHLCHCSVCRYTHGTFCTFHAPLPHDIQPQFVAPSGLDKLTPYTHSHFTSVRYFCSTCGCHIGDRDNADGRWVISSAIFDNSGDEKVWQITSHIHTSTTAMNGLHQFLPRINGRDITVSNPEPSPPAREDTTMKIQGSKDQHLRVTCHCGGISFNISRPSKEFTTDPANKKWVLPGKEDKWLGVLDVCDDCRLVSGSNVAAWIFVPVDHLLPPPPGNLLIGSSKSYSSSEDVVRTFCGTCGAVVFYSCADRPGVVDIAGGLLRDPKSVLAEDWVVWRTGRIAHVNDGMRFDEGFTRALEEGWHAWAKEKYGELEYFTV
ncbi:hypothetical protein BBP40_010931 [Aspergillus hancockii]|nr:hypothetical protein BBP40_010931 [Aspergillus hancockii]